MSSSKPNDYDRLLARHHAMRLRRQILSPGQSSSPGTGAAYGDVSSYDGSADQRLIIEHLHLVTPLGDLVTYLYEAMFQRRPYLRSLFPHSMEFQRERLAQSLTYLIENMHRPETVAQTFSQLGRDHRKLGVWPVHYETFEASLCAALRRRAGQQWTTELEQAWKRTVRFAVEAMISGADAAITEPPYWQGVVVGHERRLPNVAVLRVRTGEPYTYRAGQYGSVESPLLPHTWRQYSMACAPRPDNELEFHIRMTHRGGVSGALVEHTEVGSTLRLGPASGRMTLDDDLSRDLLMVAGGTGLAPIKAMIEEVAVRRPANRRVHLFVGARDHSDLYDWQALVELDRRYPWLDVVPVMCTEPQFQGETGTVADALSRHGDWSQHIAYVSGPPMMIEATVTRLIELNVPTDQIRYDPVSGANDNPGNHEPHGGASQVWAMSTNLE